MTRRLVNDKLGSVEPGGVVGIAIGLRAGLFQVRIPVGAKDFSLLEIVQTVCGAHPASYSMRTYVSYPWVTRPGREAGHLHQHAEVKNGWSCTSTSVCLHGL